MEKNNAQEEIIHTVNGQLLVVACPGSGKTTTLLRRIHYMINEAKIPAQQILMVTFSSAAAKEMKTRYQKKFGMDAVTFSTIHSMCMSILKKFGGYTKESILSDPREYFYEVLRKQKGINDINEFITGLITEISVINNNSIDLNSYKPKCTKDKKLFLKLINGYQEYKEELHLIDFDVVDITNLNRQQYFMEHLGMYKTDALKSAFCDAERTVRDCDRGFSA